MAVQRVGWAAMGLLLLSALAGLFANGPLSWGSCLPHRRASDPGWDDALALVLIFIIGEATQQALLGQDFSVTNAVLVIVTLLFLDIVMSLAKERSGTFEKLIDEVPTIIVADGRPLTERMRRARVDEADVMEAARRLHGIERGIRSSTRCWR